MKCAHCALSCSDVGRNMQIETFMDKFHFSYSELIGLIELCKIYGKEINIENKNNILVFKKY